MKLRDRTDKVDPGPTVGHHRVEMLVEVKVSVNGNSKDLDVFFGLNWTSIDFDQLIPETGNVASDALCSRYNKTHFLYPSGYRINSDLSFDLGTPRNDRDCSQEYVIRVDKKVEIDKQIFVDPIQISFEISVRQFSEDR